jgi:hypothetical protein
LRASSPADAFACDATNGSLDGANRATRRPQSPRGYSEGRLLEEALRDAYFVQYPGG